MSSKTKQRGWKMKLFLLLCLVVTCVVAEHSFIGYHDRIGIPLAARILEAETAAIQSGSRIIGGQPAPLGAHPYLVGAVTHVGSSISTCGSSMLSNTRAITAAHCWWDSWRQVDRFTMVFGSEYVFFGGVRVDTTDVEMHPGWDGAWALEFDIAIVRFSHVAYTYVIQPIALPSGALETNQFVGYWAQASGWGIIGDGIPPTANQIQRHVDLQVISNDVCRRSFNTIVTDRIICTSGVGAVGPVGICSSDSGGPLSIVNNNQRVLIGVVSFAALSCEAGEPSGYVRVTEHLPWIRQRI